MNILKVLNAVIRHLVYTVVRTIMDFSINALLLMLDYFGLELLFSTTLSFIDTTKLKKIGDAASKDGVSFVPCFCDHSAAWAALPKVNKKLIRI